MTLVETFISFTLQGPGPAHQVYVSWGAQSLTAVSDSEFLNEFNASCERMCAEPPVCKAGAPGKEKELNLVLVLWAHALLSIAHAHLCL
jgi:hypothetical protein